MNNNTTNKDNSSNIFKYLGFFYLSLMFATFSWSIWSIPLQFLTPDLFNAYLKPGPESYIYFSVLTYFILQSYLFLKKKFPNGDPFDSFLETCVFLPIYPLLPYIKQIIKK